MDGEVKGTPGLMLSSGDRLGQWGHMCPPCFLAWGVAIAWGSGQLYERKGYKEWLRVGGFPPSEAEGGPPDEYPPYQ